MRQVLVGVDAPARIGHHDSRIQIMSTTMSNKQDGENGRDSMRAPPDKIGLAFQFALNVLFQCQLID